MGWAENIISFEWIQKNTRNKVRYNVMKIYNYIQSDKKDKMNDLKL